MSSPWCHTGTLWTKSAIMRGEVAVSSVVMSCRCIRAFCDDVMQVHACFLWWCHAGACVLSDRCKLWHQVESLRCGLRQKHGVSFRAWLQPRYVHDYNESRIILCASLQQRYVHDENARSCMITTYVCTWLQPRYAYDCHQVHVHSLADCVLGCT